LAFLQHPPKFNPCQCRLGGAKRFESERGPNLPFDKPMVLLDNVVQIFALANFDTLVFVSIVLLYGRRIGSAFVDVNQARFAIRANGFIQKTSGCLLIAPGREEEVDSLALLVDDAIQVFLLAFDFDIRLVEPPAIPSPFLVFAKRLLDSRRKINNPTLNGTVVYSVATLLHQLFQIAIAERIGHVPAHVLQYDILLVVAAFKDDNILSDTGYFG
jgi:hypothetical protein